MMRKASMGTVLNPAARGVLGDTPSHRGGTTRARCQRSAARLPWLMPWGWRAVAMNLAPWFLWAGLSLNVAGTVWGLVVLALGYRRVKGHHLGQPTWRSFTALLARLNPWRRRRPTNDTALEAPRDRLVPLSAALGWYLVPTLTWSPGWWLRWAG